MKLTNGIYKFTFGTPEENTLVQLVHPTSTPAETSADTACPFSEEDFSFESGRRGCVISLPKAGGEHIYGFGLQLKSLEQTGKKRYIRVNADPLADSGDSHAPAPIYFSTAGYGVLVDTARTAKFYVGCNRKVEENGKSDLNEKELGLTTDQLYSFKAGSEQRRIYMEIPVAQGADVYIFTGEDMLGALQKYILFCGGGAMPPMWGLGFHYRVKSEYTQQNAEELINELREMDMPCDMLGLEPGWQTRAYSCSYLWEKQRFPNPEDFIAKMKEKGIRLSLWEHVFTHPDSEIYDELKPYSSDFEVWEGLVPDLNTEQGKEIFGGYHYQKLQQKGIEAFKLDECDSSDYTGSWSFPEFAKFPSGLDGEQMHAMLGIFYQKAILQGFEKMNRRTWSMVRSSNALAANLPFVLYSDLYDHEDFIRGLASAPFSGMLWSPEVRQCASVNDLIRRMQTTAIAPLMCANNWMIKIPAWKQFDYEKNLKGELLENWEEVFEACRKVVQLRMSLVPYLYAAFFTYCKTGKPPIRPLVLDYPNDENTANLDTEFILGESILAAPCTEKQQWRDVYFPSGNWYCFYTGKVFEGGKSYSIQTPVDYLPLFVKEGACIPLAKPVSHIDQNTCFEINLQVYGAGEAAAVLIEDDGESNDYRDKDAYNTLSITVSGNDSIDVQRSGNFEGKRYTICGIKRFK